MRIEKYLNTTKEEVEARKHNIWLGVSLGNKYFTKENLKPYIKWSAHYTKDTVLIVIADAIQAYNLEVLDGRSSIAAYKRALELGEEKFKEVGRILELLPKTVQDKARLVRWDDATKAELYQKNLSIVKAYYKNNGKFRDHILQVVKAGRADRASRINRLSNTQLDRLAEYVLNELPHFVNGVQWYGDTVYTLIPYPGLTMLDTLFMGINNRTMFPELARDLEISNKIAVVEAFPE